MITKTYNIGALDRSISVRIACSTLGVGYTRVSKLFRGKRNKLFQSRSTSGTTSLRAIGTSAELRGHTLIVLCVFDFALLPESNRAYALRNTTVDITIEGGPDGPLTIQPAEDEMDPIETSRGLVVRKEFKLIQKSQQ